jgi:hypothetical protein
MVFVSYSRCAFSGSSAILGGKRKREKVSITITEKDAKMSEKQPKKPYKDSLDKATLERYNQKIDVIGFDPYELKKGLTSDYACLPPVTYIDIINYLVNSRSAYTMEQLKAVKSLEAYNQFVNGWVQDVKSITVNNKIVVIGRVSF